MKALYKIPYGLYILTAKNEKFNGCVINTLIQVTSSPARISITINKSNYTTQMIEKTGVFNVSILDMSTPFSLIEKFGFSSGKDTNKFNGFSSFKLAENGIPFISSHTNSYLSAKVISKTDVGTHITFVADVTADVVLSNTESLTYAHYLNNIKPKPETQAEGSFVCKICGHRYTGKELPKDYICPICKHGAEDFEFVQAKVEEKKVNNSSSNKKYYCPKCGNLENYNNSNDTCIICGTKMTIVG